MKLIVFLSVIASVALGQADDDQRYSVDHMIDARKKNRDKIVLSAAEGTQHVIAQITKQYQGGAQQKELIYFYKAVYDYKVVDKSVLDHLIDSLIQYGANKEIQAEAKEGKDFVVNRILGKKLRDFSYPDKSGKPVLLSSLNEKIVVIELWASWCGPCLKEIPLIPGLRAANPNVEFYSISFDRSPEIMKGYVEKKKYTWPIVYAGFSNEELYKYLHVVSLPKYYTVDRTGTVIHVADHLDADYVLGLK